MNTTHPPLRKSFRSRLGAALFTTALLLGTLLSALAAEIAMVSANGTTDPGGYGTGQGWPGNVAPTSGNDYIVPAFGPFPPTSILGFAPTFGLRANTATYSPTFAGDKLTIQSGGSLILRSSSGTMLTIKKMVMEAGSFIPNGNPGSQQGITGESLAIGGGTGEPVNVLLYCAAAQFITVGHNISNVAGSTVGFDLGRRWENSTGNNGTFRFVGDNSGLAGGFNVFNNNRVLFVSQNSMGTGPLAFTGYAANSFTPELVATNTFSFTNSVTVESFSALTVRVSTGAVLTASGPWSISNTLNVDGGGTFRIGAVAALPGSPTINLLNNSTLDVTAVGLTVGAASATMTLSARGTVNGTVTVGMGGTIQAGGTGVGSATVENLVLTGGGTNSVDFNSTTNDLVIVNGNLTASGVTVIRVMAPPGNLTVGGVFPVFQVAGTLGGSAANYAVDASAVPQTFSVSNDVLNKIVWLRLESTPAPRNLVWAGDTLTGVNNTWNSTLPNWLNGATVVNFLSGDNVSFTDAGAINQPIFSEPVYVSKMVVDSGSDYIFAGTGSIAGPGGITKSGTGTLTLGTANTYVGGTVVNGGTLVRSNAAALGTPAGNTVVTVASGASLNLVTGGIGSATQFVVAGGPGAVPGRGAVYATPGQNSATFGTPLTGVRALRLTEDTTIGGPGTAFSLGISEKGEQGGVNDVVGILDANNHAITKVGSALLVVFATNTSPASRLNVAGGGILFQRTSSGTPFGSTTPFVISNNAFIDTWALTAPTLPAGLTFENPITIGTGGGQIRNTRGNFWQNANVDNYNANIALEDNITIQNTSTYNGGPNNVPTWGRININGTISGTGSVLCTGPAAQYNNANHLVAFAGNNTYTGETVVSNRLTLQTTTFNQSGGSYTVRDGAGLDVVIAPGRPTLPMASLTLGEFGGSETLLSFARLTTPSTTQPIIYATNLIVNALFGQTFIVPPAPSGLAIGTYPLIKYEGAIGGEGYAGLALSPLPRGVTVSLVDNTVNKTIDLRVEDVSGVVWTGAESTSWSTDGTMNWHAGGAATSFNNNDYVVFKDPATRHLVTMENSVSPAAITVNNVTDYTITGAGIVGTANLVKQGNGSLTLSNVSSFSGGTVLNAGTVLVGHNSALGSGTVTINGGTIGSAIGFRQIGNSLVVGGDFQVGGNGIGWAWLGPVNLGNLIRTITVSNFWQVDGVVSSGGLSVVSPNTSQLDLRAANTYAGGTVISNAYLTANNTTGSGTGSGAVTVQNAGILGGAGRVAGAVTFQAGSHARLGTAGVLKLDGALIIAASGTIPDVQLLLSNNVPIGNYTLATFNPAESSGAFVSTPVVVAGSLAAGTVGNIVMGSGTVVLKVTEAANNPPNFQPGGVALLPDGNIALTATGTMGAPYSLWASPDVSRNPVQTTWTLINSGTITASPFTINDLNATNFTQRFYLFSTP